MTGSDHSQFILARASDSCPPRGCSPPYPPGLMTGTATAALTATARPAHGTARCSLGGDRAEACSGQGGVGVGGDLAAAVVVGGQVAVNRGTAMDCRCLCPRRSSVCGIAPDPGDRISASSAAVWQGSEFPFAHGPAPAQPNRDMARAVHGQVIPRRPAGRRCAGLAARNGHDLDRGRWSWVRHRCACPSSPAASCRPRPSPGTTVGTGV